MAIMSVSVPDDLKDKMSLFDEVNWSAVARKAFEEKIKQIEMMKEIAAKSQLSEKDAEKISADISKKMSQRFRRLK